MNPSNLSFEQIREVWGRYYRREIPYSYLLFVILNTIVQSRDIYEKKRLVHMLLDLIPNRPKPLRDFIEQTAHKLFIERCKVELPPPSPYSDEFEIEAYEEYLRRKRTEIEVQTYLRVIVDFLGEIGIIPQPVKFEELKLKTLPQVMGRGTTTSST